MDVEVNNIRLPQPTVGNTPRQTHRFLKGPIPMEWLSQAYKANGRALAVGVLLWHVKALQPHKDELVVFKSLYELFGLSRWTFSRGLSDLEKEGLARVRRRKGCSIRITLQGPGCV